MCNITNYLKAGQPALRINTNEVERAITSIRVGEDFTRYRWDTHRGVINIETEATEADVVNAVELVQWLEDQTDCVLFAQNFHYMLNDVEVLQALENGIQTFKSAGVCFVLIAPEVKMPKELDPYFMVIDFDRPDEKRLEIVMNEVIAGCNGDAPEFNRAAVEAAKGLTEFEAETAFALSLIETKENEGVGAFEPELIVEQKKQMIKKSGLLEFHPPEPLENLGGFNPMKAFFENRKKAYEPGSKLPKPKGVLLVGHAGCGKSLTCKVVSSILGWPLIRMDISSLKGSLVGQSEQNINTCTQVIEAFGRAVVWWDEIEKALSGAKSSAETGDTAESMLGLLLTWMQETKAEILVMASANDIDALPAAFKRAGRFDAIFFADLPPASEREEIISIMDRRYGSELTECVPSLVKKLAGWTGAEIEQLAKDSLFDGIETAMENIIPLSVSQKRQVEDLQAWAANRARRANDPETKAKTKKVRKIS
jgi:hypothetical protein